MFSAPAFSAIFHLLCDLILPGSAILPIWRLAALNITTRLLFSLILAWLEGGHLTGSHFSALTQSGLDLPEYFRPPTHCGIGSEFLLTGLLGTDENTSNCTQQRFFENNPDLRFTEQDFKQLEINPPNCRVGSWQLTGPVVRSEITQGVGALTACPTGGAFAFFNIHWNLGILQPWIQFFPGWCNWLD